MNPRKKTLEQAMGFVAEAQLIRDVAGKVKLLVLSRYQDMTGAGPVPACSEDEADSRSL